MGLFDILKKSDTSELELKLIYSLDDYNSYPSLEGQQEFKTLYQKYHKTITSTLSYDKKFYIDITKQFEYIMKDDIFDQL